MFRLALLEWRDSFYAEVPQPDWFEHYLTRFDTVEINASFYSWPTVAGVRAWRRAPGKKKFVYTVKVCELITHVKEFKGAKILIKEFGMIADILGERMGCFLFSFRQAIALPGPGSMTPSASSIPRAATSLNSGTPAGGMTRSVTPSARPEASSAPAAGRACPTSSSALPMKFTSVCTAQSAGIGTTTQTTN
jgi:hypothetical protein